MGFVFAPTLDLKSVGLFEEGTNYSGMLPSVMLVHQGYIRAALRTMRSEFGGAEGYLKELGVTREAQGRFRSEVLL